MGAGGKGEKSVVVKEWTMLAKALVQPPEKFTGSPIRKSAIAAAMSIS